MKMIPYLFLLVLAASLNGCFLLLAGGAGAEAGYTASQKDRTAGETVSDQWIHTKVKTVLMSESGVPSGKIDITVRHGVVTLKGVLSSSEQKSKALSAAKEVKGVKNVVDKIFISQ